MLNCPDTSLLSQLLTSQLDPDTQTEIEGHIEGCARCQHLLEQLTQLEANTIPYLHTVLTERTPITVAGDPPPIVDRLANNPPKIPPPHSTVGSSEFSLKAWPNIPGYEIVSELGRGGTAVVFQARHLNLNRQVALKILRIGRQHDESARDRLQHEARTLARLRHPNIVHIFDIGEYQGRPYFSLELVVGRSLARWMDGFPQPPRLVAELMLTVANAVDYAHRNGVLHRDLKPGNILIDAELDSLVATSEKLPPNVASLVKVTDFGLAKVIDEMGDVFKANEPITEPGSIVGTPQYMAPEQAQDSVGQVGPSTDVYAIGVILYELLTGRPPFAADIPLKVLYRVIHDDPVPVQKLVPGIPNDLVTICAKCMEKDHYARYQSAQEVADELRRYLSYEPILARPVGVWGWFSRWVRRRRGLAAMIFTTIFVILGSFAIVFWQWRIAVEARNQAESLAKAQTNALREIQIERDHATELHKRSERLATELLLDKSRELCERGSIPMGLRSYQQGLEMAIRNEFTDLERVFRANLSLWAEQLLPTIDSPLFAASVRDFVFSPDGQIALIGTGKNSNKGYAQLWDPYSWKPKSPELEHAGPVNGVALSPTNKNILSGADDGTARIWHGETFKVLTEIPKHWKLVRAVAFAPDGKSFAVAGDPLVGPSQGEVRIFDAESFQQIGDPLQEKGIIFRVAYHPFGSHLVTGCGVAGQHGYAQQWDLKTRRLFGPQLSHQARVGCVAYSPSGTKILTGSSDKTAQIWDALTGDTLGNRFTFASAVDSGSFSPDEKSILVGMGRVAPVGKEHEAAVLIDLESGKTYSSISHLSFVWCCAFRPDGEYFALSAGGLVRICKTPPKQPVEVTRSDSIHSTSFSPDGRYLICSGGNRGTRSGHLALIKTRTGETIRSVNDLNECVEVVQFSPTGQYATLGWDGVAQVWDTQTGQALSSKLEHRVIGVNPVVVVGIASLQFTKDGRYLLVASANGISTLWDWKTGIKIWDHSKEPNAVQITTLNHDTTQVLIAGADGIVRIYETVTGKLLKEVVTGNEPIFAANFSANAGQLFLVNRLGIPHVLQLESECGSQLSLAISSERVGWIQAINSHRFYTLSGRSNSNESILTLWDGESNRMIVRFPHLVSGMCVATHSQHKLIATGGASQDVRLWDSQTGQVIGPKFRCDGPIHSVQFAPNGRVLTAGGQDGVLKTWSIPPPLQGTATEVKSWLEDLLNGRAKILEPMPE